MPYINTWVDLTGMLRPFPPTSVYKQPDKRLNGEIPISHETSWDKIKLTNPLPRPDIRLILSNYYNNRKNKT